MELYAWRANAEATAPAALVGRLQLDELGAKLAPDSDPALQQALATLLAEPYLPLTVREVVDERRFVRCERKTPGEPGYWAALADALGRATGLAMTTSNEPPTV
jgi:hypothetical protein